MPYLTLTLSGYDVDLPADAAVALSYRANDLRTLDSREASFSETFTLPLTAQNVAVLGSPHSVDSLTTTPYRLLPAVLRSPGGVVLLDGFAILELTHDGYDVTLTDATGGLFAQVGSRKLRDTDLQALDHTWDYPTVRDSSAATAGYTYALADIGYLVPRPLDSHVLYWEQPACVFALAVLEAIVRQALPGYRVRGTLLADSEFQALVLPRATASPQLRASRLAQLHLVAAVASETVYTGTAANHLFGVPLEFPALVSGDPQLFTSNSFYQTPAYIADLQVKITLRFRLDDGGGPFGSLAPLPTVHVVSVDGGGNDTYRTLATVQDIRQEQELVVEADLPVFESPNAKLKIMVILREGLRLILLPGSQVEFIHGPRAYPGGPVHLDASLPDISQADWLKLLVNKYNIIFSTDAVTKVLRCDLFNDLERRRDEAVDWSAKLDFTHRPRLAFRLGEYAQRNVLRYDDALPEYVKSGALLAVDTSTAVGAGTLLVTNSTLPATADAYQAPVFLPRQHAASGRGPVLWLPFWKLYADDDLSKLNAITPMPIPWYSALNVPYDATDSILHNGRMWLPELSAGTGGNASYLVKPGNPPTLNEVDVQTSDGHTVRRVGWKLTDTVLNDELPTWALLDRSGAGLLVHDQEPGMGSYTNLSSLTAAGLSFADTLTAYYPGLAAILRRVQVLTVDVRLTALDIAGLDFTRPVRLSVAHWPGYGKLDALCYLNLVDQYSPSSSGAVPCTLLVLGNPVPGLAPLAPNPTARHRRALATEESHLLLLETGQYILLED